MNDVSARPHARQSEAGLAVAFWIRLSLPRSISISAFTFILRLLEMHILDRKRTGLHDGHTVRQQMIIPGIGTWLVGINVVQPAVPGIYERDCFRVMHIIGSCIGLIVIQISPA